MSKKENLSAGSVPSSAKRLRTGKHKVPGDLRKILISDPKVRTAWEDITPLARNEWICWVESVKKEETRKDHVRRFSEELKKGKRRPCCWIGCIHRSDKSISPSVKGILNRRSKK